MQIPPTQRITEVLNVIFIILGPFLVAFFWNTYKDDMKEIKEDLKLLKTQAVEDKTNINQLRDDVNRLKNKVFAYYQPAQPARHEPIYTINKP